MSALDGRVALVTGGGRGIGEAIVRALHAEGAKVVIADSGVTIAGDRADPRVATNLAAALGAVAFPHSVAGPGAARAAVACATDRFGRLDIVVNNAAILRDGFVFKADPSDWLAVIETNLTAAFHVLNAATPVLRAQAKAGESGGRIVNVVSTAGLYGNYGHAAYASAEAGLIGLTRATALDMARSGVTANAVAPFAHTRVTEAIQPANDAQARYKAQALGVPAESVARFVAHLCTPAAQGITGQTFGVRGREVFLFAPARPAARTVVEGDPADAVAALAPHFAELTTDLEAFNTEPILEESRP